MGRGGCLRTYICPLTEGGILGLLTTFRKMWFTLAQGSNDWG